MVKRCKVCKVPLEGWKYKISSWLFGIRPSKKKLNMCNKCEKKSLKK